MGRIVLGFLKASQGRDLHYRVDFQRLEDNVYKHTNSERAELGLEPVEQTVLN